MDILQRPPSLKYLVIRGDKVQLSFLEKQLKTDTFYGIRFKELDPLGDKILIIDLETDTFYFTEEGFQPYQWQQFNYPEHKQELIKELCDESKRRFEDTSCILKTW